MADYIFIRKSRNAISSFLHIFLNFLLGVGSVFITLISGSPLIGIILILISKWRIFAVRPRYWFLNIRSSLVDLIVGISFVLLAYIAGTDLLPAHIIFATLYAVWLILIKPRTGTIWTIVQSLIAIFIGSTAATLITSTIDVSFFILAELLIGYAASNHIFIQSKSSEKILLINSICALICAEFAWLCHSWNIIYTFDVIGFVIPQFSIIITLISFAFAMTFLSVSRHDGHFDLPEILPPIIFSLITILVIVFAFSSPIFII